MESEIIVKLGAHNIRLGEWKRQKIPMCHQIPHPQYNEETDDNDIMLLQGDSGGPLVCGKQPRASSPGEPPGVYTSVFSFIPWIQETMKRLQP
ncbi:unnamed protein product [Caretta caretta]